MSVEATQNERLAALTEAGTSVWLDQIKRSLVEGGELARMVKEDSLRGVTSNPAIFEKAILGSEDYDEALVEFAKQGLDTRELYQALAIYDVQGACDILRAVYDETDGYDGYVSFEVDPDLAFDTDRTIEQAREYWKRVDRPNLMIKIPGTTEGLPAVEEALYEGINVNVTLLFSVDQYREVMRTFIRALERRLDEGKDVSRIHSVASFFVSRVDSEVDKRLEELGRTDLQGRAGLANARAAYQAFKEVFHGGAFERLRKAGAPVQRPLWASTGVKNPAYPETLYVYQLVAPETVNTMPLQTLIAASEQGSVSGSTADQDPTEDLQALSAAGISLTDVTDKLLKDGIDAFVTPMEKLLEGIESRREAIVTDRPQTVEADLPFELEPRVGALVRAAEEQDVARRIWRKDETLWGPAGQPEVANRLGWLTIVDRMTEEGRDLMDLARSLSNEGYTDAVLLGMGGSSLAPEVFRRSLGEPKAGAMRLHVLDSTDPKAIADVEARIDLDKTIFIVSTKSGGTIETRSLGDYFLQQVNGRGEQFLAITDPGSSLLEWAERHGVRRTWENDPEIGGRYSALSFFGLVPAALAGVDVCAVLERASIAAEACTKFGTTEGNSGLWLGIALGLLAKEGRDKLTFIVDPPIDSFGVWVEQLIAESLGKLGRGALPIAEEPVVETYGEDRVFIHLRTGETNDETLARLRAAGHPALVLQAEGVEDLGRLFFFAEFATAVAGWVLGVNPFDQPNVAQAKANTNEVLEHYAASGALPEVELDAGIGAFVGGVQPGDYVAILGYLAPDPEVESAAADLRAAILTATGGVATTFGYGPRYLHSTGQLHKGGPAKGHFLFLLHDLEAVDRPIPDQGFTFGTLKNAQAIGDVRTLRDIGRPVAVIRIAGESPAEAIRALGKEL